MTSSHHLHTAIADDIATRRIAAARDAALAREARAHRSRGADGVVRTARAVRPGLRRLIPSRLVS